MEIDALEYAIMIALKEQSQARISLSRVRALIIELDLASSPTSSQLFPYVENLISYGLVEGKSN